MKLKHLLLTLTLGLGLTLAVLLGLNGPPLHVWAATHTVTNTDDSGAGSLRQAIAGASDGDTIDFNLTYPATITLTSGQLEITKTLTISGPGAGNLAISGGGNSRVISITSGVAVTITGVTVRDGSVTGEDGGGIYSQGDLVLKNTHIVSNSARHQGYLGGDGGGVYVASGSAVLTGTQVYGNSAVYGGGGVYIAGDSAALIGTQVYNNSAVYGGGGVCIGFGSAVLTRTQVYSNSADWYGGGVYVYSGSALLTRTQVYNNSAVYWGGGVCVGFGSAALAGTQVYSNSTNAGGGVYVASGSATLTGTQVYSNSAVYSGGGIFIYQGSAVLHGARIAGNDAPKGGALESKGFITSTTPLTITGEIFQTGGVFYGADHDLRIEGALVLAEGDFYAPTAFMLTGPFTHTGGTYHQTRDVTGSSDVGFPKAGGVILNANGQDLGSTEVALTAGANCAGVSAGEAVTHCYRITPTNATGRDATVTFYYRDGETPSGQTCAAMEAYRWDGTWDHLLTRDGTYGTDGRMCGSEPRSIRVKNVADFSPFVLSGLAENDHFIYLPLVMRNG